MGRAKEFLGHLKKNGMFHKRKALGIFALSPKTTN
jgi:hypothetical protein